MDLKLKVATCVAVLSVLGCSSEPDIEVSIEPNQHWGTLVFTIQAISDEVVVEDDVIS